MSRADYSARTLSRGNYVSARTRHVIGAARARLVYRTCSAATLTLWLGFSASFASAHHSVAGFFDPNETVELEGVVTSTIWRNPHTVFEIDVSEDPAVATTWRIETGALGDLCAQSAIERRSRSHADSGIEAVLLFVRRGGASRVRL